MNGAAPCVFFKFIFIPAKQAQQFAAVEAMAGAEIMFSGRCGKTVPWTHQLAVIATIDAVADQRAQLHGDSAAQFDGEVGDTQTGIERVRCNNRLCRAAVDTAATAAAVIVSGGVRR